MVIAECAKISRRLKRVILLTQHCITDSIFDTQKKLSLFNTSLCQAGNTCTPYLSFF